MGVVPVGPTPTWDAYQTWVAQGYAGEMAYLARPDAISRRQDPRHILPETRSVLVVAASYAGAPPPELPATARARLALRLGRGLPPLAAQAPEIPRAAHRSGNRPLPPSLLRRYRPHPRTRLGASCGPGLDWQEHQPDPPASRLVHLLGRGLAWHRSTPNADAPPAQLRQLHALPRRLPHRRVVCSPACSTRGAASPTSPSNIAARSRRTCALSSATASSAATPARTSARGIASRSKLRRMRTTPPTASPRLARTADDDRIRLPRAIPPHAHLARNLARPRAERRHRAGKQRRSSRTPSPRTRRHFTSRRNGPRTRHVGTSLQAHLP